MLSAEEFKAQFPIATKWPPQDPGVIQLYSLPTPNGIKASAMLEESGLPYEAHLVNFGTNDQMSKEFLSLNPNNKIPAMIDPNGPGGKPIGMFESGAMLLYLAEKSGKLIPTDTADRYEAIQWLMWQMGGVGPMFGQFGWFWTGGGAEFEDERPLQRYVGETRRLLGVLEDRLKTRDYIMGADYTICDVATWPWYRVLIGYYDAADELGVTDFPQVASWYERCSTRPASERAATIPSVG